MATARKINWLYAALLMLLVIVIITVYPQINIRKVTWIANTVDKQLTCEEICQLHGSKVAVDGCYAKNSQNTPQKCTLMTAGYCADWKQETKIRGIDYSHACCCKGTNFAGCTSTDGTNPFRKGTTTDKSGHTIVTDYCVGDIVIDYMCDAWGGVKNINNVRCPGGCRDGACV